VVLDRLATPLGGLLGAAADGDLSQAGRLDWRPGAAVNVVVAAAGYPDAPASGEAITGLDKAAAVPGSYVLQAGTTRRDGQLVSSGGRVLNVIGTGADVPQARSAAYAAAAEIQLPGGWYRTDIAGPARLDPPPGTTEKTTN
jgi:phosphoribosylamine--glycine ligase